MTRSAMASFHWYFANLVNSLAMIDRAEIKFNYDSNCLAVQTSLSPKTSVIR